VKPGGAITRPPADLSDDQFDGISGTSFEQVLAMGGQTDQEVLVKVDAVDAIATLAQEVVKLQAQLAAAQGNWRWCHKCQGLWFAGSPATEKKPCPAGGEHSQDGSGDYRLLT
jgi:hypothetical protein